MTAVPLQTEQGTGFHRAPWRAIRWGAVLTLMLAPAVAMRLTDQVNWGPGDFAAATLLLGGDPSGRPEETYASWREALALPAVRGLVVGRTLLYPPDDDVASAVDTAVSLVH